MKIQAIIPTAGTGTRLKAQVPKPMVEIHGKPLFVHTLSVFENCPAVDSVIVVGIPDQIERLQDIIRDNSIGKVARVVPGGDTRCRSVRNGIAALDGDTEIVLIHDGARPLVSLRSINAAIVQCDEWDAVITAVRVKPTIKKVDPGDHCVMETLDRETLWEVQTPQVFKRDVIERAHRENNDYGACDDAVLVERLGIKVRIVPGDYHNIKITTPDDLVVAEHFLKGAAC